MFNLANSGSSMSYLLTSYLRFLRSIENYLFQINTSKGPFKTCDKEGPKNLNFGSSDWLVSWPKKIQVRPQDTAMRKQLTKVILYSQHVGRVRERYGERGLRPTGDVP